MALALGESEVCSTVPQSGLPHTLVSFTWQLESRDNGKESTANEGEGGIIEMSESIKTSPATGTLGYVSIHVTKARVLIHRPEAPG